MKEDDQAKLQQAITSAIEREQIKKGGSLMSGLISLFIVYWLTKWFPDVIDPLSVEALVLWLALTAAFYVGFSKLADRQTRRPN
jgi:hypothetical protein